MRDFQLRELKELESNGIGNQKVLAKVPLKVICHTNSVSVNSLWEACNSVKNQLLIL